MINVLVAIPINPNMSSYLAGMAKGNVTKFTDFNPGMKFEYAFNERFYTGDNLHGSSRHAQARNGILDIVLCPEHDYILWIDADIILYPADLPSLLYGTDNNAVVAPLVLREGTDAFYDFNGFIEAGNKRMARVCPPYFEQKGPIVELDSVGCVYMMPALPFHNGVRYKTVDGHTEHWSVMEEYRKQGHRVICNKDIVVIHADLQKYGEDWHDNKSLGGSR